MPLVDDELRRIARQCVHDERGEPPRQATELVNEGYLRLVDAPGLVENRAARLGVRPRVAAAGVDPRGWT